MHAEILQCHLFEELLVVPAWLVPVDVRKPEPDKDGADIRVLELDGTIRTSVEPGSKGMSVSGLRVVLTRELFSKHVEVITDDRLDFGWTPIIGHRVGVYPSPASSASR